MDKVHLIVSIFTFTVLVVALFVNFDYVVENKTALGKLKVLFIISSIVGLIIFFRILAQYSFVFLIAALLSIGKNKHGNKQDSSIHP